MSDDQGRSQRTGMESPVGLEMFGPAKSMDEMRQERPTDNGM
jgi:hypothetical protein